MLRVTTYSARSHCALLAVTSLAFFSIGCGSMVDSQPPTTAPESNVSKYYTRIQNPGNQYYFSTLTSKGAGYLTMTMKGTVPGDAATYYCDWKYKDGSSENWYYAVSPQKAEDLGGYKGWMAGDRFVDLQSPLSPASSWSFPYEGDVISAHVTGYGVTAQIGKTTYNDVVQVSYSGKTINGVRWFARGIGQIFSNMTDGNYQQKETLDSVQIVN